MKQHLLFQQRFARCATGRFFLLAKYIPGASFWIVCFSTDEQREKRVTFPQCLYKKDTPSPGVQLWKNILYRKERSSRDINILLQKKPAGGTARKSLSENKDAASRTLIR